MAADFRVVRHDHDGADRKRSSRRRAVEQRIVAWPSLPDRASSAALAVTLLALRSNSRPRVRLRRVLVSVHEPQNEPLRFDIGETPRRRPLFRRVRGCL